MRQLMVANDDGVMSKEHLKKLCYLAKCDWQYDETSKTYQAEIENIEEARFIAMKVRAAFFELPAIFCCYSEGRKSIFFLGPFGYQEM